MTATVGPDDRQRLLRYASLLFPHPDRGDPVTVASAALPLLEWAEAASGDEDLNLRMEAMSQQSGNSIGQYPSPAEFVESARTLYAFLTGGSGVEVS